MTGAPTLVYQFGEPVTYFPQGAEPGRSIRAIVERDVATVDEAGEVLAVKTFVGIIDSATDGIAVTEFDSGRDKISFPFRLGEDPTTRQMVRVGTTSIGLIRYEVQ